MSLPLTVASIFKWFFLLLFVLLSSSITPMQMALVLDYIGESLTTSHI